MAGNGMSRGNPGNKRTALVLAVVAFAFFAAIMFKYWLAK